MGKYENIIPDNVQTNTFEYRSAVVSMEDIGWDRGEIEENGSTIEDNSLIKAQWHQQITLLLFLIL